MKVYTNRNWRRWFAWYPVKCGTTNHIRGMAWLEIVEYRDIGEDPYERASITANYTYRFLNDDEDAFLPHRSNNEPYSARVDSCSSVEGVASLAEYRSDVASRHAADDAA